MHSTAHSMKLAEISLDWISRCRHLKTSLTLHKFAAQLLPPWTTRQIQVHMSCWRPVSSTSLGVSDERRHLAARFMEASLAMARVWMYRINMRFALLFLQARDQSIYMPNPAWTAAMSARGSCDGTCNCNQVPFLSGLPLQFSNAFAQD